MSPPRPCPQCGAEMPADAPQGACPRCLFRVGLGDAGGGSPPTEAYHESFVAPPPETIAQLFPQLEVLELLGQGGMGAVYKARQVQLDRIVALKILPPRLGSDPAFADRFAREARALARLNHPNIVTVYDSGQTGGLFYFLMEFVDGINLRQAIHQGTLSPQEALAIVPQICDALQYAHDEGVVHRDVKPENILLDQRGKVKVADFGLAKLLHPLAAEPVLTAAHQVLGTPRYMAPEQIEGRAAVDHRADIYSLGVVFYELLTGELPIGRFAPPSQKVRVDVRLDEVVLRTLEKEPDLRYQQVSQMKTDVEAISRPAAAAPVVSRAYGYGYEYRSAMTIVGVPLVHVATGIDPATGRKRVARGVIAIGDVAVGVLAVGGVAVGGVAVGGVAGGLFTLGGVSIGLALAGGGLAVGSVALGGMAVGGVAIGGGALGYYAYGGSAIGVHAWSGQARDPAAEEFISQWGPASLKALVNGTLIGSGALLGLVLVTVVVLALLRRSRDSRDGVERRATGTAARKPPTADELLRSARRSVGVPAVGLLACGILNLLLPLMLAPVVAYLSLAPLAHDRPAQATVEGHAPVTQPVTRGAPMPAVVALAMVAAVIAGSLVLIVGGTQMMRLKHHGLATFAAVVALVPCTPAVCLSFPFGIAALVVLHRDQVQEAFELNRHR